MQIKDNITATSNPVNAHPEGPIKVVKLRSEDIFAQNADKLMEPTWVTETKTETPVEAATSIEASATPVQENQNSQVSPASNEEPKENDNVLPLTSEEVLLSKKNTLGIETYKDVESNIINLKDYQNARRLRVNQVVVGNANRTRNVLGIERIKEETEIENDNVEVENQPFDFASVSRMNEATSTPSTEVEPEQEVNSKFEPEITAEVEEPKYDNDTKLDEWLNKENNSQSTVNVNDSMINEVNELQSERNDKANSLATQKEILEALRARIANNEELCRQRKLQLEEENLQLTQELNDVLAEINQLTSLANEQEAFLGISNDDEVGKSRAA